MILLTGALWVGNLAAARADIFLANPDWDITITDHGYSDLLFYNNRPFPPGYLPEMLSGEWGAAVGYDGITDAMGAALAESAMWLEPDYLYPDWTTNSGFVVVTPTTDLGDPDADGLPEAYSVISNGTLQIRIDLDMEDTLTGTPMGLGGGGSVESNRYVLLQSYTLTNVSPISVSGLRFYAFLHAHPANSEVANVEARYDASAHTGALSGYRYDFTQFAQGTGAPDGSPTGFFMLDHVGFASDVAPDASSLGHYRGHGFAKPPDDDVEPDGDGDGVHREIERDTLEGETSYGPDEVGSAGRWSLGSLAPLAQTSLGFVLAVRSAPASPFPGDTIVEPDSGAQIGVGLDLALPLQAVPLSPPPGVFPPLLIGPAAGARVTQTFGTMGGGAIIAPPGLLTRPAPGAPGAREGVFPANPAAYQMATSLSYAWPDVTATLAPGGGPGSAVFSTASGGTVTYSAGSKQFGGPARFAITPGPGAATGGRVQGRPVTRWLNFQGKSPVSATAALVVGEDVGLRQPGATGGVSATTMNPATPLGLGFVSLSPGGLVVSSVPATGASLANALTRSRGWSWTTGVVTVSQPSGSPPQLFVLTGTDMRIAGVGNISLVSGGLSVRSLTGPTANRGWLSLTLPEPGAVLGLTGALAALGCCHGLRRRRRRKVPTARRTAR